MEIKQQISCGITMIMVRAEMGPGQTGRNGHALLGAEAGAPKLMALGLWGGEAPAMLGGVTGGVIPPGKIQLRQPSKVQARRFARRRA